MVKNPPAKQETWVQSLDQKDPLEKKRATHSRILAWRIPWAEEPGGLQSKGWQRVRHDWATNTLTFPGWLTILLHPAADIALSGWLLCPCCLEGYSGPPWLLWAPPCSCSSGWVVPLLGSFADAKSYLFHNRIRCFFFAACVSSMITLNALLSNCWLMFPCLQWETRGSVFSPHPLCLSLSFLLPPCAWEIFP